MGIMTVAVLGLTSGRAHAQDAPAQAPAGQPAAGQPAAGQPAAEEPKHPAFHGSLSVGLSAATGVQEQRAYQFEGDLTRPFSDGGRFVANVQRQYQNVTFPSPSLLADRSSFAVGADQNVTKYTVAMARSMYLKDALLYVNSRYEEIGGYGLHAYNKEKNVDLALVPGFSVYKENLAYAADDGWKTGYGFLEKFSGKFKKVWSIENSFRFRRDFSDSNRSIESVASITGMLNKAMGVQFEFQYNYESVVPPDFPNYLTVTVVGLKFQF